MPEKFSQSTPSLTLPVEVAAWDQFELLDSGDGQKLERWGKIIVSRPEPRALWRKAEPDLWRKAVAVCNDDEEWVKAPADFDLVYGGVKFHLRPSEGSKHLGLFPEQEPHWKWLKSILRPTDRVLNLFSYTGAATLVASQVGCQVTHVDASKSVVQWARNNAALNGMEKNPIRWIVEDAMAYIRREEKRGSRYDVILLDPPSFGRGPNGELWKIDAIAQLLEQCAKILSEKPRAVLLTMYNLEASPLTLANLLEIFKLKSTITVGSLALKETGRERYLPLSLYGRAYWK